MIAAHHPEFDELLPGVNELALSLTQPRAACQILGRVRGEPKSVFFFSHPDDLAIYKFPDLFGGINPEFTLRFRYTVKIVNPRPARLPQPAQPARNFHLRFVIQVLRSDSPKRRLRRPGRNGHRLKEKRAQRQHDCAGDQKYLHVFANRRARIRQQNIVRGLLQVFHPRPEIVKCFARDNRPF